MKDGARAENGRCTVIGTGSRMDGTLQVEHTIYVDGVLCGELRTPTLLVVGEGGQVTSRELDVGEAEIYGRVTGHLRARRSVRLGANSCLEGSVETPRLVIEEGAHLIVTPPAADAPG